VDLAELVVSVVIGAAIVVLHKPYAEGCRGWNVLMGFNYDDSDRPARNSWPSFASRF
jgi:hypothetical protein